MNTFPKESEEYLREHPIIPNKDVNNFVIQILINMRKKEISKALSCKIYSFPAMCSQDYPKKFLRCNGRRYLVRERGSDGLRFFPVKQMGEDIVKYNEQSILLRYPIPKYDLPLSQKEMCIYKVEGWDFKFDKAVEQTNTAIEYDGYDSAEEEDLICSLSSPQYYE